MSDASNSPAGRINEPEEAHGKTEPVPHHHVNYFAIFGTLVVLTVVTVAVAFVHIESELIKVLVALAIASVKAACVAFFFMHLKFEGKLIYSIFIVPLLLCILLTVALIPDVLMTHPGDHSSSLKTFNDPSSLFSGAVGGDGSGGH
jgi:cytochrome c oxidase subunit 4